MPAPFASHGGPIHGRRSCAPVARAPPPIRASRPSRRSSAAPPRRLMPEHVGKRNASGHRVVAFAVEKRLLGVAATDATAYRAHRQPVVAGQRWFGALAGP